MLRGRVLWRGVPVPVTVDGGRWLDDRGEEVPREGAVLLPPAEPSKIVCVGRNYALHAKELGNPIPERPLIFLKAPSAVIPPGGVIRVPPESRQVEYEGEIALVVGRRCYRPGPEDDPMSYIAGVTALNDVTARDLQKLDVQFTRAKSFDTFCPFGPFVEDRFDAAALGVVTVLNGAVVQEGRASDMIFPLPDLVRFIAACMTLLPGDLIATGTPAGVGPLKPGDSVSVTVAGITLENSVEAS